MLFYYYLKRTVYNLKHNLKKHENTVYRFYINGKFQSGRALYFLQTFLTCGEQIQEQSAREHCTKHTTRDYNRKSKQKKKNILSLWFPRHKALSLK